VTAPYFTDATGPIDFYDESHPEVQALIAADVVVDAQGNHHGARGRFVPKTVEYPALVAQGPAVSEHVTIFDLPPDPSAVVEHFGAGKAAARMVLESTVNRISGRFVLEDGPDRIVHRREYANGRVVWIVRPRRGVGAAIEVYEEGEPRFADFEAEYRRRSATPPREPAEPGFAAYGRRYGR
jgi:hypothetical protein